jgi:hypothetical protein
MGFHFTVFGYGPTHSENAIWSSARISYYSSPRDTTNLPPDDPYLPIPDVQTSCKRDLKSPLCSEMALRNGPEDLRSST